MVQTFLHVAVPPRPSVSCPFERLPTELQRMVIHEALPNHLLRPRHPPKGVHTGRSNYWDLKINDHWGEEEESSFAVYLDSLKDASTETRDPKASLNLLLVSKRVSTMTRSIYDNEIPFVINIHPMCFHFLERIVNKNLYYPTYTDDLPRYPHFRRLHNFELDFNHDPTWWRSCLGERHGPPGDHVWLKKGDPENWWKQMKEWVQIICDTLSRHATVHRLTIYLPCLCRLKTLELVTEAEVAMIDLLSPLRQLKVAQDVKFIWLHRDTTDWKAAIRRKVYVCHSKSLGGDLVRTLQTKFGRLDGELLPENR
ncbi:MAG: hypothetical protein LQ337_003371 [Flavoplaca oasis]|nr:MAG: hypothetical protein LQ337_003371 [Flavoplaca oasis]